MVNNKESLEQLKSNSLKQKNNSHFLGRESDPTRVNPETPDAAVQLELESHSQENQQQKMADDKVPNKKPNIKITYKGVSPKEIMTHPDKDPNQEPLSLPHAYVSSKPDDNVVINSRWRVTGKRSKRGSHVRPVKFTSPLDKKTEEAVIGSMMTSRGITNCKKKAGKEVNQECVIMSRRYESLDDDDDNDTYYCGCGISTVGSSSWFNAVIRNDNVDETGKLENNLSKDGALSRAVSENSSFVGSSNLKKGKEIMLNAATPLKLKVGRTTGNQSSMCDDVIGSSNVEEGDVNGIDELAERLSNGGALHQVEVVLPSELIDLNRERFDLNEEPPADDEA